MFLKSLKFEQFFSWPKKVSRNERKRFNLKKLNSHFPVSFSDIAIGEFCLTRDQPRKGGKRMKDLKAKQSTVRSGERE